MSNRRYNTQTRKNFNLGGRAKLDADGDGKITGKDFAMLRGKKKKTSPSDTLQTIKIQERFDKDPVSRKTDLIGDDRLTTDFAKGGLVRSGKPKIANDRACMSKGGSTSKYHTTKEGKKAKKGLWYNIAMKRKRGEKMRKKGEKGAPTEAAIKKSQS